MHRVLILFLLKLSVLGYCQNLQICLSDSLEYFSVVPSLSTNSLEWEFIYGDGAEIVDGQFSDSISVLFTNLEIIFYNLKSTAQPIVMLLLKLIFW